MCNRSAIVNENNTLSLTDTFSFVADRLNHTIRQLTPAGTNYQVTTIAGLAQVPGGSDGTNTDARFNNPMDVQIDGAGNLLVADSVGQTIGKLVPMGTNWVVTSLGATAAWQSWTNSPATDAGFVLTEQIGPGPLFFRLQR